MAKPELARFIDRETMEYVRIYPHPIERVWRAIVDPAEFGVWFIPGRLDPRVGGEWWFGDDGFQGVVAEIEPPRRLRLNDAKSDYFLYELSEAPGGTRFRFVHHIPRQPVFAERPGPSPAPGEPKSFDRGGDLPGGPDTPWKPGFVGGFHEMFDDLTDFLDGVPCGSRLSLNGFGATVMSWAVDPPPSAQGFTAEQRLAIAHSLRMRDRWGELIGVYRQHIRDTIPMREAP